MNELERILSIPKDERTQADLDYLEAHKDELTEAQAKQLEVEKELDISPLVKNIGTKVVERFETVIEELEDGLLRAIVNSGKEDRHGEILDMDGLDTESYMRNPILANAHDYSKPSVGVTKRLIRKGKQLIADFKFATDVDHYDEPKILDGLYRKGYQFAFSIGFIPHEVDKNKYTKATMVEFSPVLIPADGNALLLAKKKGLDKEILESYNINSMNELQKILAKVEKEGIDSLTVAEIKYLNDNRDDLSANQIKGLADVLKTAEPEKDETKEAIKDLTGKLEATQKELEVIKSQTVEKKDINGQHDVNINLNGNSKMFGNTKVSKHLLDSNGEPSKEAKFLHFVKGLQTKDFSSYQDIVGKSAMNTSDDAVLLPPQEFVLEVERLEEEVGVAERFANVRRATRGSGIKYVMGDDDLAIFDTAEHGVKKSTVLSYKQLLLAWRKWAGILPITDELTEDAAFDLWADAVKRFARAFARKADQLVFTNAADTGVQNFGILYETGTHAVTASGITFASVTSDDLLDMIYGVPSQSAAGGRFYVNREFLGSISKLKDQDNRPLWLPSITAGAPGTILGKPYTEVEVLAKVSDAEAGLPIAVFGDLKYATLGIRTDLQIKIFDTGLVGDPDDADQSDQINLMTQDVQAMRAVKRMNAVVRFPEAFSVLKLASAS